jgi:hypothetical protein
MEKHEVVIDGVNSGVMDGSISADPEVIPELSPFEIAKEKTHRDLIDSTQPPYRYGTKLNTARCVFCSQQVVSSKVLFSEGSAKSSCIPAMKPFQRTQYSYSLYRYNALMLDNIDQ